MAKCTGRADCQNEASKERHGCPYAAEIHDDDREDYCDCCDDCTQECALDI